MGVALSNTHFFLVEGEFFLSLESQYHELYSILECNQWV